jgi:hypothetical protein
MDGAIFFINKTPATDDSHKGTKNIKKSEPLRTKTLYPNVTTSISAYIDYLIDLRLEAPTFGVSFV